MDDTVRMSIMELRSMRPGARRRVLRAARKLVAIPKTEANAVAHIGSVVTVAACEAIEDGRDPFATVTVLLALVATDDSTEAPDVN